MRCETGLKQSSLKSEVEEVKYLRDASVRTKMNIVRNEGMCGSGIGKGSKEGSGGVGEENSAREIIRRIPKKDGHRLLYVNTAYHMCIR